MSKNITIILLFVAVMILGSCAAKKEVAEAGTAKPAAVSDAAKLEQIRKTFSEDDLAEGKTIMQAKCNKCHKLFEPQTRTVAKWEWILPSMLKRSKLNELQAARVRAYILLNAKNA